MGKRLFSMLLIAVLLLGAVDALAITELSVGYTPGETHHIVDAADVIATDGASVSTGGVSIEAGGSATFGFYLPYSSRSLTFVYSGSGNVTVETGENTYSAVLSDSGEYVLEFGMNLGMEKQLYNYNNEGVSGFYREFVEHRGEKEVKISCDNAITITQLKFEKELTPTNGKQYLPNVSDEVNETLNTVFLDTQAPVIVVHGAKRYVDNDNTSERPYNHDGSLYLPINTLAKALGYYHEDIPEKGYALMRSDTHEVVLMGDKCTVSEGLAAQQDVPANVFLYKDGKTMAAVRYFAELDGKTVAYRNGLIVIDDKYTVEDILASQSCLAYAENIFKPFKSQTSLGKTYYVAQTETASDDNSGSAFAPFKTLAKASSVAQAGDTVIIRGGVYRETLAPQNSGTASSPITFRAAEGEKVVISANDELNPLVQYDGDVYVTNMPVDLGDGRNQVFINDEMQTEARYPNGPQLLSEEGKLSNAWPVRGDLYRPLSEQTDEAYNYVCSDTLLNQEEDDYWAGATFVGLVSLGYAVMTAKVDSSEKGRLVLSDEYRTDRTHWWVERESYKYNYGYLVGHEHALDAPGEWVRTDEGILKMILPEGVDAGSVKVEAKARQLVIDLATKSFIHIEGIETIGGSVRMNYSEMCMLNGMNMKYITHYTLSADQRDGYIDFPFNRDNRSGAPQRGEVGIFISGTDNIIVNSVIDHSAGAAVYLVGTYTYLENNIMNECGYMGSYVAGIQIDTQWWDSLTTARGGHGIYNNTVSKIGRAAINIESVEVNDSTYAPYLPMDIGYNSFSDGMLTSSDGGMTYAYGINVGMDRSRTQMHHNYVYVTTEAEDAAAWVHGIYWDGLSHGSDTYQNLVFHTEKESPIKDIQVFEQSAKGAEAWHRIWENHVVGYVENGVDGLLPEYFSENRPFNAGSSIGEDVYTLNYDRFAGGSFGMPNTASQATLSEGAALDTESGYASFTGDGQWIDFGEVDFGTVSNELSIAARGDSNNSFDEIEIIIDEEKESCYRGNTTLSVHSPDLDQVQTMRVVIPEMSGRHTVKLKVNHYASAEIGGISVYYHAPEYKNDDFAMFAYGGEYNARINLKTGEENAGFAEWHMSTKGHNPAAPAIKSTFPGNYVRYDERTLTEDATHMVFAIGSRAQYRKQLVSIYLDSLDSEPVAQFRPTNKDFFDYTPTLVELNRKVAAGTYDVYIVFGENDEGNGSTNLLYFGFLEEGADLSPYKIRVKEYGGMYDADLSVQDAKQPFFAWYMNPPQYTFKGLMYTLPGTTAAYTNVDIPEGCTKLYVDYAAEEGYAGQTVEIRLNSADGEPVASFVTEARSFADNTPVAVDLSKTIAEGTYTVYVSFGGATGSAKTCRLSWFGFGVE